MKRQRGTGGLLLLPGLSMMLLLLSVQAGAEPYLAVRTGFKCFMCHSDPAGGGQRTEFGNYFAQTGLVSDASQTPATEQVARWDGWLNQYITVGADYRGEVLLTDSGGEHLSEFSYREGLLYLSLQPLPDRVSLYVDEKLGPGSAFSRQAFALLWTRSRQYYVKAGHFLLPFGLRLEDDDALTRAVTGINFDTPDDGIEFGIERGAWTGNLALTNGTGIETNNDKRISWNGAYVSQGWRGGASLNRNDTGSARRDMAAVYAGVRGGPLVWLFEYDHIDDRTGGIASAQIDIALAEVNWQPVTGHNIKLTYEALSAQVPAATDNADQHRYSLVWEYFPVAYLQFRLGLRSFDSDTSAISADQDKLFLQLHLFF